MSVKKSQIQLKKDIEHYLSTANRGNRFRVIFIPDGLVRTQMIRFGIMEGEILKCIERLPGGTILIQKNRQEIAIGLKLAEQIKVIPI